MLILAGGDTWGEDSMAGFRAAARQFLAAGVSVAAICGATFGLALEAQIAESETGWRQLYNELGLTPFQVIYEELSTPDGYEQTIRGVLAHLGLADYQGPIPAPQTRRQANHLNEAWVAAYLADRTSRQEH